MVNILLCVKKITPPQPGCTGLRGVASWAMKLGERGISGPAPYAPLWTGEGDEELSSLRWQVKAQSGGAWCICPGCLPRRSKYSGRSGRQAPGVRGPGLEQTAPAPLWPPGLSSRRSVHQAEDRSWGGRPPGTGAGLLLRLRHRRFLAAENRRALIAVRSCPEAKAQTTAPQRREVAAGPWPLRSARGTGVVRCAGCRCCAARPRP